MCGGVVIFAIAQLSCSFLLYAIMLLVDEFKVQLRYLEKNKFESSRIELQMGRQHGVN